jgi:hypothetical protein
MPPPAVATTPIRETVPHTLRSLYISAGTLNLLSKEATLFQNNSAGNEEC